MLGLRIAIVAQRSKPGRAGGPSCGSKLWAQHLSGHDYYREESALRGIPCPNSKTVIRAEILEAQVERIITALRLPASWREVVVKYLHEVDERQRLTKERDR